MSNELNVLFIGLGSIATRHLKNLNLIYNNKNTKLNVDAFRTKNKSLPTKIHNLIRKEYFNYDDVPSNYDIIFITNPTNLHIMTLEKFLDKGLNFFIEKPLCDIGQDISNIYNKIRFKDGVFYVACPLRYTSVIQYVKNNIDFNDVYSVRSISSSYLPNWRPDIDYRETYSAHKSMGGGVSIDLIHEWDYLFYLLGKPKRVYNFVKKISHLEIDSDDIAIYIAEYENKLVELHLDYFGRKTIRKLELFTKDDTIRVDLIEGKIEYLNKGKVINFNEERNDFQLKELEYFLDIISGKKENNNNFLTAFEVLKVTGGLN